MHSCLPLPGTATRNRSVRAETSDSFTEVATTQLDLGRAREERGGDTFACDTVLTAVKARLRLGCPRQMCKHDCAACAPPPPHTLSLNVASFSWEPLSHQDHMAAPWNLCTPSPGNCTQDKALVKLREAKMAVLVAFPGYETVNASLISQFSPSLSLCLMPRKKGRPETDPAGRKRS